MNRFEKIMALIEHSKRVLDMYLEFTRDQGHGGLSAYETFIKCGRRERWEDFKQALLSAELACLESQGGDGI